MQKNAILFSAGEYQNSKLYPKPTLDLPGVKYDILAIEKRLQQIGFSVTKRENISKADYLPALQQFADCSPSDAIHIVYFSGHGGHYRGENYIYPSDFATQYDITKDVQQAGIDIKDIIDVFKGKGRLILILDACRGDFGESKSYFSEMTFSENVYIAYGTMFQNSSISVNNGLSWFTEAICNEILTPNIDVDTLFTRVRQNIFIKHHVQIPPSVNALLDKVILHPELYYNADDEQVYNFIKKYSDMYTEKYGYFQGDDLIFIDAAQYFNIGLLDAIWKFQKVDNKVYANKGVHIPELSEAEAKVVSFLGLKRGEKFFSFDDSHTWYYNGRQIRMGEIPPLPPSMQQRLPEEGKAYCVNLNAKKENNCIFISTNLPDSCEIFITDDKNICMSSYEVKDGKIVIENAKNISKVVIDSAVSTTDETVRHIIGDKCRNLIGKFVMYHPIHGNQLHCIFDFA